MPMLYPSFSPVPCAPHWHPLRTRPGVGHCDPEVKQKGEGGRRGNQSLPFGASISATNFSGVFVVVCGILFIYFFILESEEGGEKEREKRCFVVPLIYLLIG